MQNAFISWLDHWQTLFGALIGGIMGFIGAQWVASSARYRDEVISAKILIVDMMSIIERTRIIDSSVEHIEDQYKKIEFVLRFLQRKPISSPMFDSAVATLMACNHDLTVHLAGFRKIYLNVEHSSVRMEKVLIAEALKQKIPLGSSWTCPR